MSKCSSGRRIAWYCAGLENRCRKTREFKSLRSRHFIQLRPLYQIQTHFHPNPYLSKQLFSFDFYQVSMLFPLNISDAIIRTNGVNIAEEGDLFAAFDEAGNVRGVAAQLVPSFGPYEGRHVMTLTSAPCDAIFSANS